MKCFRLIMLAALGLATLALVATSQMGEPIISIAGIWIITYIGTLWVASWED